MAFTRKYAKLEGNDHFHEVEDIDLEDSASDTTKASSTIHIYDKTNLLPLQANENSSLEEQRTARRARASSDFWTWMRWGTIVGLQTILILLLSFSQSEGAKEVPPTADPKGLATTETGGDINGLYKTREYCFAYTASTGRIFSYLTITVSHTYTFLKPEEDKYVPNMTSNDNRMEIRKNWDMLMPRTKRAVQPHEKMY